MAAHVGRAGCLGTVKLKTLYYYYILLPLVTGLFSLLLLLLNQRRSSPLRLQVSNCSTFGIMRDFPSIAVFCSESFEHFPGMAFRNIL